MFRTILQDIKTNNLIGEAMALLLSVLLLNVHPLLTILFFIILLVKCRKIHIRLFGDLPSLLFLASVLLYAYGATLNGFVTMHNIVWTTVPAFLAFCIGRKMVYQLNSQKNILLWLLLMSFFLALPHMVVTIIDILSTGLVNPERTLSSIGDGSDAQRAVTQRTVELSLAIAGVAFLFCKNWKDIPYAKMFIAMSLIAELCSLHYVSRTGVVLFIIAIIIGIGCNRMSFKTVLLIGLLLLAAYLIQDTELFNVFKNRESVSGADFASAGGRTERWTLGFMMLMNNPGGYSTGGGWYAHNFWLDFGLDGGLWSFVALVLFSLCILITSIKLFTGKLDKTLRFALLLFSLIFIATLFSEPIHTGARAYMFLYFMFCGMVLSLRKRYRR